MAEAISQNAEITEITANIIPYPVKTDAEGTFSTLLNNVVSKTEQTKTNFIDKAVKSNTSSINQYAIKNDSAKPQEKSDIQPSLKQTKPIQNTKPQEKISETNQQNLNNEKIALKSSENKTVSQNEQSTENSQNTGFVQTPVSSTTTQAKPQENQIKPEAENVNNDSLESSPVLFENPSSGNISKTTIADTDTEEKITQEIKEIVENILITFDIPINQDNNDNSVDTDMIFNNAVSDEEKNVDYVIKAIDEISSQVEDFDLGENKEKVLSLLDKLKTDTKEIKENIELDNSIKEVKTVLDSAISKITTENTETVSDNISLKQTPEIPKETVKEIKNTVKEIKKAVDEIIKKVDLDDFKTISDDIAQVVSDVENALQDSKIISDVNRLKSTLQDVLKSLKDVDIKDSTKLSEIFKNIKTEIKSEVQNLKTDIKEIKTENNIIKTDVKDFEIKPDDTISEIVSKLKEFEKTQDFENLSDEDKIKIESATEKLSLFKEEKTERKEPEKIIEDFKEENSEIIPKEPVKTVEKDNSSAQDKKNEYPIKTDNPQNQNTQDNQKDFRDTPKDNKVQNTDRQVFKKENNSDNDIKLTDKKDEPTDKISDEKEISNNENEIKVSSNKIKGAITKEIKEDFLEDISYTNDSPSALTVSDEVVKLSLVKNNGLTSQMPVGSVTYDPANSAVTIRNVQNIAQFQMKEAPQDNILNQIGDKLYQLKDSQKLTLVLRPDNLGRLSIELTSDKNGLTTNIVAQNEHVRGYIEKNINSLRNQLAQAGVSVNTIQIKTAGQNGASTYEGNQGREFQQQQQQQNQNQQRQEKQQQGKNEFADVQNYDMHFAKDFSSVLNKTLSYIN